MILVDTSTWIAHKQKADPKLTAVLANDEEIATHTFVYGELYLGTIRGKQELLHELSAMEFLPVAEDEEVLNFAGRHHLSGAGIGWVDCHLIASAKLAGAKVLTRDQSMRLACAKAGVATP